MILEARKRSTNWYSNPPNQSSLDYPKLRKWSFMYCTNRFSRIDLIKYTTIVKGLSALIKVS